MEYNKKAFNEFITSLEFSKEKKDAIKELYLSQLEYLSKEGVTAETIKDVTGLNGPLVKSFSFLKSMGEDFKKNFSMFDEDKK